MKETENKNCVESLLDSSIERIKKLIDVNTIVGDPVVSPSGSIIIPISRVSVGFVVGGGEYSDYSERRVANRYPMAGGSAGGVSVSPVGFLIETDGEVKYIDIDSNKSAFNEMLRFINTILSKIPNNENNGELKDEKKS